jgi:hypothetical protein
MSNKEILAVLIKGKTRLGLNHTMNFSKGSFNFSERSYTTHDGKVRLIAQENGKVKKVRVK